MTVNTISTYGSLQTLLQNMGQAQNSLNTDEVQISSGQISQTFDGISGSVEQLTAINAQLSRLNNYQSNNTTYLGQLNSTNTILGQVQTLATNIKGLIAQQMSGTGSTSSAFTQQMNSDLTTLSGLLNTNYAGNSLFGGTATNTPPVKTPIPSPTTIGTPDASYYQGSSQTISTRISDNQEINNSITAANPAFQNLIGGILQAIQSAGSSTTTGLQNAENLISTGISGVISLQANVNSNIVNVQAINSQSQSVQTYLQGVTENMTQSDVVALSTKVAQDQNVLEATFQVYSRISSLTLSKYL
jgi:flagellar hook-associated protein 3 FlgL